MSVTAGYSYTLAVRSTGTLWATGSNISGQLGVGNYNDNYSFTQIGTATTWQKAAAAESHSGGLKADGTLSTWGFNGYGQLGNNTYNDALAPVNVMCPTLGVEDNVVANALTIYPNPASDMLYISAEAGNVVGSISIVDMYGKRILQKKGDCSSINISGLASGVYLIQMNVNDDVQIKRFIKS
jgi:hypothetical protein